MVHMQLQNLLATADCPKIIQRYRHNFLIGTFVARDIIPSNSDIIVHRSRKRSTFCRKPVRAFQEFLEIKHCAFYRKRGFIKGAEHIQICMRTQTDATKRIALLHIRAQGNNNQKGQVLVSILLLISALCNRVHSVTVGDTLSILSRTHQKSEMHCMLATCSYICITNVAVPDRIQILC